MDARTDEENARRVKRTTLRDLNNAPTIAPGKALDSSLKRHTALIKRMRLSIASDNRDQILKDIDSLALEKYVDELSAATVEGVGRCKTEKDVWAAVEVISALHRRLASPYTASVITGLGSLLVPPSKESLAALTAELREKEDSTRISRQRPVLRVSSELALVGIIRDVPKRSGGEWIMKAIKGLLSNDPTLSSLPLLSTFLKSYSRPFLGISPPAPKQQTSQAIEPGSLSAETQNGSVADGSFPELGSEEEELVEKETRDRFKKMCEGYFESVSKKLVIEHKRLQDQDRRNHEAYIRSGEIFEDRQQAYEKMTKGYEKLLAGCQTLSELLYLPLPKLPVASSKTDSIQISTGGLGGDDSDELVFASGGKWEDEEERRFFEDIQDLKDFVPKGVLVLENRSEDSGDPKEADKEKDEEAQREKQRLDEDVAKIEAQLKSLELDGAKVNGVTAAHEDDEDDAPTPTARTPKEGSPPGTPQMQPQGPSQMLTALLARLPDCTNRSMVDQSAVDFAFLNSKAARKRLVKFLGQVPKNRTDLLPHYSRLVATLNKYMPDVGTELIAILDEEFRYLQRKKNVVKELSEVRLKNMTFLANLTKFGVVPTHLILHIFKVCLDDMTGTNVDNIALLLEGCGRYLLRSDETRERFGKMVELMRRKQSMQHLDQRQLLVLENAYYQCNPPERGRREEKIRTPMEHFIRHLIYDVLAKKTIDKVLKLIRKLNWEDQAVVRTLHKVFAKPWRIKYGNMSLLAMLTYDLQRYHPSFTVGVVDQVLENIRLGMEINVYKNNQRRVADIKFLGELYIYRLFGSSIIFDTFWSLVTFGRSEGRVMPQEPVPLDMPDDFFRIRLVCVLLDTCGMCFESGSQKQKLDSFLTFFQYYVLCKDELPMDIDFMMNDSLEAVRPKMTLFKSLHEAAAAVDEMFSSAFQRNGEEDEDDDSGEDSDGEGDSRLAAEEDDEEEDDEDMDSERSASPEAIVHVASQENLGPSEEEDGDFVKELAKMLTESSAESRKVDKRTAMAMWDSSTLPAGARKKRTEAEEDEAVDAPGTMNFTLLSKRGNKPQARSIAVPAESALAVQTRTAQLQDKEEQQQLKRLVLNYEQREEEEEIRAIEARSRHGAIKIRFAG